MAARRFDIDPGRSSVTILATSSVHDIHADAPDPAGWVELSGTPGRFGPKTALAGEIEVASGGLAADNKLVEREMRRRVDARRHPAITGEITGVDGASGDEVQLVGTITFLGITQEVRGTVSVATDGDGLRVTGSQELDVRAWGLSPPKIMMLKVHPEVTVTIDLALTPP